MGRKAVSYLLKSLAVTFTALLLAAAVLSWRSSFISPEAGNFWASIALLMPVILLLNFAALIWWLFRRRPVVRGVVLLLLLATAGFADVQLKSFCLSRKAPPAEDGKLYLRGRIDRLDTNYRGRPRIVLGEMYDFEDNPVAGRYRLSMIHRDPGLEVGDCVEMVAAGFPRRLPTAISSTAGCFLTA